MGGLLQGCWDCAFCVGLFVCVLSIDLLVYVAAMVGPGTPPLGQPPGLTPARASLPRGLTPDPGAAHGGEDGPHPGPHPPTPGTAHGGNDPKQGSCSRWKGE